MKIPSKIPESCKDCSEFDKCPFPDLKEYLKELVHQRFHGNTIISFKNGIPGKIRKEEVIDFQRI